MIKLNDKILIFGGADLIYLGVSKHLQNLLDCNLYYISYVDENQEKFLKEQTEIKFRKLWFYSDIIQENKKPDYKYLDKFEKKYDLNIWKIALTDRRFYPEYNVYHKFSSDEILSLIERACKFFDSILEEVNPHYIIMKDPWAHYDLLLYEMCLKKKVIPLLLRMSRLGARWLIASKLNHMDEPINNSKIEIELNSFEDFIAYYKKYNTLNLIKNWRADVRTSKIHKFKQRINFLFTNDKSFQKHYVNYGRTKWKILTKGSSKFFQYNKRKNENFLNKISLNEVRNSSPFIYYALHAEPERSLLVGAPFYSDQIEIIRRTAKSIPIEFEIYVREHPAMKKWGWRPKKFYEEIDRMPNVKLVSPSVHPNEIYPKCSLVMTISGTSAFEASLYKKPSIIFADSDITEISSIFRVKQFEDLPQTIAKALKTIVNPLQVKAYLEKLHRNSFVADINLYTFNFLKEFPYLGYNQFPTYPKEQVFKFLQEDDKLLQLVANEYAKKINHYKKIRD